MSSASSSKSRIVALGILAGLISGSVLAALQIVIVRPYVDGLSSDWINFQTASGQFDEDAFNQQLQSIYLENLLLPIALGFGAGVLVGVAYALNGERTRQPLKFGVIVGAILWFVLGTIPSIKYPLDPAVIFDATQAPSYLFLLATYTAVSGAAAVGSIFVFRRSSRKTKWFGASALYLCVIAAASALFPEASHTDQPFSSSTVLSWRMATSFANITFWLTLGIVSGLLWSYGGAERLISDQARHPQ
jgi:predicted cobalt transporter CbtA